VVVIDEADKLFQEQSNTKDMTDIITQLPPTVQYLFFSATFEERIVSRINELIPNLERILVQSKNELVLENVSQYVIDMSKAPYQERQKIDILTEILEEMDYKTIMIFVNTK
jgi:superfamily II DNA/RNA helicase